MSIWGNAITLGGSGGGADTYAFIVVTYPAGSTCTATDGTTTLTAPDTSGSWVCKVPNAGTWTVSCTDGTNTASAAVSITTEGQSESVALSYALFLISDGRVANGYAATNMTETTFNDENIVQMRISGNSNGIGYLTPQVDVSQYRAFRVKAHMNGGAQGTYAIGLKSTTSGGTSQPDFLAATTGSFQGASTDFNIDETVIIPDAAIGNYYFAVWQKAAGSAEGFVRMTEVYLSL